MPFVQCTSCKRHFRGSETMCPFCFARRAGSSVAFAMALGGAVGGLGACRDAPAPNSTTITSSSDKPATTGDNPLAPAASDAAPNMAMSPPRPVYGPPAAFPGDRIPGLKGALAIAPVTATVPIANAEKQIRIAQPALRTCYQTGLRTDPNMAGTLKVTISVGADGKVTNVTTDGPLGSDVQDCMKDRLQMIKFDAPGKPSTVTTEFTCTSTHD